ncbi:uncharacterized protein LOC112588188 [Harpegnathos saltator]|uniref:uncharacterized protein LOC112588188 n=1 Tax=Harpegnathos saltator TaxID=610380 RepID=UPI000DBEEFDD|nr:uncharacterized protein LOC112588188 [Harpegnathos saltator]
MSELIQTNSSKSSLFPTSAILDQDTSNVSKEDENQSPWWEIFNKSKNNSNIKESRNIALNLSDMTIADSTNITGNMSANIVKTNILETTSESEKTAYIKKKKAPLKLANRKSRNNNFLSALNTTEENTLLQGLDKETHTSDGLNNPHCKKISSKKLEEGKEDDEDLRLDNIPLAQRSLDNLVHRKIISRKLQERKKDSEDSIDDIPLKQRVKISRRKMSRETSNIFQNKLTEETHIFDNNESLHEFVKHPIAKSKNSNKSHTDDLNSSISRRSLSKAQRSILIPQHVYRGFNI